MQKNPKVYVEEGAIIRLTLVIFLCFGSLMMNAQSLKHLDELGKAYNVKSVKSWTDENEGVTLSRASDERYLAVTLPQFGKVYRYDFNKVNGAMQLLGVYFGKAALLKELFSISEKERFKDNAQTLPFGLKIGMTQESVEAITGRLVTHAASGFEEVEEAYLTNLPGFRFLDVTFWFQDKQLVYFKIETNRDGAVTYQRHLKALNNSMQIGIKAAIEEKYRTLIKLSYGSVANGIRGLLGEYKSEKIRNSEMPLLKRLKYTFRVDTVMTLPDQGYRMVWCMARHKDKQSFYDELLHYLNMMFNKGYRNNSYEGALIDVYQQDEIDDFEHYFFDAVDRGNYREKNTKTVFRIYQVAESNEVVLETYEPADNRVEPTRPTCIGVCEPENPDLALSDDEYLEKLGVDIELLKTRFAKHEGNSWLKILGGGEWTSTIGFEQVNGYNEETGTRWLKGLEFKLDKEFSRSVFKGSLPLGFKKGMKLSQIKTIIPGVEYEKWHSKEDWFTTYEGIRISPRIALDLTMSFRSGKLGRLVVEMDEKLANSREWEILKHRIFTKE
ncbi:MAG: hypothetical protein HEP71_32120 [Roseivirga sp.]|nr:hypothetical protein [Roseivirga sp.]